MESQMSASILSFRDVLTKFRKEAFSERDKGTKFERLMKSYLQIAPEYEGKFKEIWLWDEFPFRNDFSGKIRELIWSPKQLKVIIGQFNVNVMMKNPASTKMV